MTGKLYLCGTPIGNLEDITFRVLRTLKEVDVVYAEDTRHTVRLLTHFEISKPLHSYHEHNKNQVTPQILDKLRAGEQIALVSDAGMPGISDPGADLVKACIENGLAFEVLPGVTAFTTALVGSGLDTRRFSFEGFLTREKKERNQALEDMKYDQRTLIFYESPHRLKETIKIMGQVFGEERQVVLAKELTKKFETYYRASFGTVMELVPSDALKGEWVIVVEASEEEAPTTHFYENMTLEEHLNYYIREGLNKKEAMKQMASDLKCKKSDIYNALLATDE